MGEIDYNLKKVVYPEIRKVMLEQNLSERELARIMGMTHTTLSRKLHGESTFSFEEAVRITDILVKDRELIFNMMRKKSR